MSTSLVLRSSQLHGLSPSGDAVWYDMLPVTWGGAADTCVVNTQASGTEIQFTKTAGGSTVAWISPPVPAGGFTLTSTFLSAWAQESNMSANIAGRFRVFKRTAAGSISELGGGPFALSGAEWSYSAATEYTATGNVTDTSFAEGDRILLRLYITNAGTMGGGYTGTLTFNTPSGATGDSFFQIAETIAFKPPYSGTALALRNTQTHGRTPVDDVEWYDLLTTFGDTQDSALLRTVASGTEVQFTKTDGGSDTIGFISERVPAGGFTLTAAYLRAALSESNVAANCTGRFRLFKYTAAGSVVELGGGPFACPDGGVELTSILTYDGFADVTDATFAENDRILLRLYITNVGTMGGNYQVTAAWNDVLGSVGGSFLQLAETVSFKANVNDRVLVASPGYFTLTGKPQSLLADRKLSAGQGAFTLTGKAQQLLHQRQLTAAGGMFTLTGEPQQLRADRLLVASAGLFTWTGYLADLVKLAGARVLLCEPGYFTLTGEPQQLHAQRVLAAGQGAFSLDGQAQQLLADRKLSAGPGAYVLTGEPADVRATRVLVAGQGAFVLTGEAQQLLYHRILVAGHGDFVLTGEPQALLYHRAILASVGAFTLTGEAVTFGRTRVIVAATGLFTLTGEPADLHKAGIYLLEAAPGYFTLTGEPQRLLYDRTLTAAHGVFTIAGEAARIAHNRQLTASAGLFTLAGQPAGLLFNRRLSAGVGLFSLTGFPAILTGPEVVYTLVAAPGYFTLTGEPTGLVVARRLPVAPGYFSLDGQAASLKADRKLLANAGLFTLDGQAALVARHLYLLAEPGQFRLTGEPATLLADRRFLAQPGYFTLDGQAVDLLRVYPWLYFVDLVRDGPTYWHRSHTGFSFWQHPHGG